MTREEVKEKLGTKRWSFSSIDSFDECPRNFYLHYILHKRQKQNAFAEWGSYCHEILEAYFKGDLNIYQLGDFYEQYYKMFNTKKFPPNKYVVLADSYHKRGLEYFKTFSDPFKDYEVVGVEQEIETKIGKYNFVGYIDLILRDKQGNYIIVDHKSIGKMKSPEMQAHKTLQLYLYSKYIYETYGKYPTELKFNMFRAGTILTIPFDESEYIKALNWAESTIDRIYEETSWMDKIKLDYLSKDKDIEEYSQDDFFCNYLCGSRKSCDRAKSRS